jgi:hypothetical protein
VAPAIRDFLYVDVDRVRSLLAQLSGGVVEQSVERLSKSQEARAGGSIFGLFDLGGSFFRESASEQTKTLQDATFLLFEDAAAEAGLFDTGVDLAEISGWKSGHVHKSLEPGQLLRVTALTRILDSEHFRARVDRFAEWPRLVATFAASEQLDQIKSPKERERRIEAQTAQLMGGAGVVDGIKRVGEFIQLFLAGQISLRQFPCGLDHPELGLTGSLLGRPGYLQEEREALFAKYGSIPTDWTVVSQVATVPTDSAPRGDLALGELMRGGEQVDRSQVEDAAMQLMEMLEGLGVAEGPAYPAITVTPLAVYREFESGA